MEATSYRYDTRVVASRNVVSTSLLTVDNAYLKLIDEMGIRRQFDRTVEGQLAVAALLPRVCWSIFEPLVSRSCEPIEAMAIMDRIDKVLRFTAHDSELMIKPLITSSVAIEGAMRTLETHGRSTGRIVMP